MACSSSQLRDPVDDAWESIALKTQTAQTVGLRASLHGIETAKQATLNHPVVQRVEDQEVNCNSTSTSK